MTETGVCEVVITACVLALPVLGGNPAYLQGVRDQTRTG